MKLFLMRKGLIGTYDLKKITKEILTIMISVHMLHLKLSMFGHTGTRVYFVKRFLFGVDVKGSKYIKFSLVDINRIWNKVEFLQIIKLKRVAFV